jgi:hypothetical protein
MGGCNSGGRNEGIAKDTSGILADRTETMVLPSTSAIREHQSRGCNSYN